MEEEIRMLKDKELEGAAGGSQELYKEYEWRLTQVRKLYTDKAMALEELDRIYEDAQHELDSIEMNDLYTLYDYERMYIKYKL